MDIDIDNLSEPELVSLNSRVVERLRFLQQMRAYSTMLEFRIGERVFFQPEGRPAVFGILTRYNKKTVTVITDSGEHWNVAPSVLRKAGTSKAPSGSSNVLQLHKK
ncbi:MAG: hypothetical protein ABI718_09130 [Acidobacteriota bacterium]